MHLGAHMSIAGGLHRAVERALSVDATALALFVKSSNRWAARPLDAGEVERFRAMSAEAGLQPYTVAHSSYLINLASPDDALQSKSVASLGEEMDRCGALGIPFLVVHPGSHTGSGVDAGIRRIARGLDRCLSGGRGGGERSSVTILLETTAGTGNNLGSSFEELAAILERVDAGDRLGVCFDTCHALAAGYEFRDAPSYRETFRRFERTVGFHRLRAFHLNDSRNPLGSRKDRHEQIGRGEVGLEAFRLILNDRRFRDLPMVLETPKGDDLAEDRVNLAVLRELIGR